MLPKRNSPYLAGRTVDWLFAGGLSVAAYIGLRLLGERVSAAQVNWLVTVSLAWLGNAPHFSATCYRLYHSRQNRRQYPYTAYGVPLLVALGIALSLAWPERIAPYFVKLYLLWSPYHYSGQSLGLSLLYARRAGFPLDFRERLALAAFIYGTFLTSTARVEADVTRLLFVGIEYPTLGLAAWVPMLAQGMMWAGGALFLGLTLSREKTSRLPLIVYLPAVAQYTWLVLGSLFPAYFFLVPFFHGIQYLLVAWLMQLGERAAHAGSSALTPSWRWRESIRWGLVNAVGGVTLFAGLPFLISLATQKGFVFTSAVALAGVQIHHFFVDGVIWKLKNPKVASLLLLSWKELGQKHEAREAA